MTVCYSKVWAKIWSHPDMIDPLIKRSNFLFCMLEIVGSNMLVRTRCFEFLFQNYWFEIFGSKLLIPTCSFEIVCSNLLQEVGWTYVFFFLLPASSFQQKKIRELPASSNTMFFFSEGAKRLNWKLGTEK